MYFCTKISKNMIKKSKINFWAQKTRIFSHFDHRYGRISTIILVKKWLANFFIVFFGLPAIRRFQGAFIRPSISTGRCSKFLCMTNYTFENFWISRFSLFWTLATVLCVIFKVKHRDSSYLVRTHRPSLIHSLAFSISYSAIS